MTYDRSALAALVQQEAVAFGDFTLASGKKSHFYIDCRRVTLSARGTGLIGPGLLPLLEQYQIDVVGGLTLGADPVVSAVLAAADQAGLPLRGCLARKVAKDHGTGRRVEGPMKQGDRVLVVDDVATSGGSCVQAIEAINAEGGQVVAVAVVLDRLAGAQELFAKMDLPLHSLLTVNDLNLEAPA